MSFDDVSKKFPRAIIFFPTANIVFKNKITSELLILWHLKAFSVKKMFIQVLLVCLLQASNFFPSDGIFFPMIIKWLFLIDFYLEYFIVIMYCMFGYNMDNNFKLYNEKVLILEFMIGKWIKNAMRVAIYDNDLIVEKIVFLLFLDYLFNLLLLLLITNQPVMVYFVPKWSNIDQLLLIYIVFTVTIENGAWKHCHLQTIHYTQTIFVYSSTILCNFVCIVSCTMFYSWTGNQYLDDRPYCNENMIILKGILYDVCAVICLLAELIYFAIVYLVHWLIL